MYVGAAAVGALDSSWQLGLGYALISPAYDWDPDGTQTQKIYWGIFGLTATAYIINAIWIYRAAANAQAVDPIPQAIKPGWSVGWYFIPIANLWMPFRAMRETWASSVGTGWPMGSPLLLKIWWATWVTSLIISNIANRAIERSTTYEDYIRTLWYYLPAHALDMIAGLTFAMIIKRVSDGLDNPLQSAEVFT